MDSVRRNIEQIFCSAKYNILEKELDEFKEKTGLVQEGLHETVASIQLSLDAKETRHKELSADFETSVEQVSSRLEDTSDTNVAALNTCSSDLISRIESIKELETIRNEEMMSRLEAMENRILASMETNSELKGGIAENRRRTEENDEIFKTGLRTVDKKTTEAFILIEKLKVNLNINFID